ncbi:hypothetical protein CP157_03893 (plasmid) [Paracoccus marcusii]|uniref:metallophosphoesterase family protein n=1 Tax=Paracoccus marcusii TaxID=59779 RepID=UPI001C3DFF06|nr:metallophosphoesterase family protein [Paracoccus marcusii]QXI66101.1 hypothetical protein CP157_03893 [Paracoccus marcusii]
MADYFTADTHFGDDHIRRFFSRPFVSTLEMDTALVAGTQSIKATDNLWIIGDFACCNTEADRARAAEVFDLLPGQKHLVCGNHDDEWVKRQLPWSSVQDMVELDAAGRRLVLCHYPMVTWNGARDGAIHLFGHVHTNWRGAGGQVNVGVDLWGFRPVTVAEAELRSLTLPPSKLHARAEGL